MVKNYYLFYFSTYILHPVMGLQALDFLLAFSKSCYIFSSKKIRYNILTYSPLWGKPSPVKYKYMLIVTHRF
jgi:hypothetical protein